MCRSNCISKGSLKSVGVDHRRVLLDKMTLAVVLLVYLKKCVRSCDQLDGRPILLLEVPTEVAAVYLRTRQLMQHNTVLPTQNAGRLPKSPSSAVWTSTLVPLPPQSLRRFVDFGSCSARGAKDEAVIRAPASPLALRQHSPRSLLDHGLVLGIDNGLGDHHRRPR